MKLLSKESPRVLSWYLFTDNVNKYDQVFKEAPDYFAEEWKTFQVPYITHKPVAVAEDMMRS